MRETKFRAWNNSINEFCYAGPKESDGEGFGIFFDWVERWNLPVTQYIGLKDKKRTKEYPEGQEIYEGDIVKCELCIGEIFFNKYSWDVKQMPEYLKEDNAVFFDYAGSKNAEIIGNIYQNPELLCK